MGLTHFHTLNVHMLLSISYLVPQCTVIMDNLKLNQIIKSADKRHFRRYLNIFMDSEQARCKIVNCIVLAQSKVQCGAVVNMVMNNRHPKKWEFCNKLMSISF